jgi:hypothetical protein
MLRNQTRTGSKLYSGAEFHCTLGILECLILKPICNYCMQTERFKPDNCCQCALRLTSELQARIKSICSSQAYNT